MMKRKGARLKLTKAEIEERDTFYKAIMKMVVRGCSGVLPIPDASLFERVAKKTLNRRNPFYKLIMEKVKILKHGNPERPS